MWSQRKVVDCGFLKRAVVEPQRSGRTSPGAVCDAQPYLLRAARHLCPRCEKENVTNETYVYGDSLKSQSGAAKIASQPVEMAHDYDEFRVYVVEVCQGCSWNHLTASFVLGNGPPDLVGRP
ncbi:DUF5318 family protein [Nonomuraea sp. NPDC049269]